MKYAGKGTPQSRFACQLPFQGSLFPLLLWKASPERGGGPLAVEGSFLSQLNLIGRKYKCLVIIGICSLFVQVYSSKKK